MKNFIKSSTGRFLFLLCFAFASRMLIFAKTEPKTTVINRYEYRPIVISTRTVTAGTAYQPSVSRATLVIAPGRITCTSTLAGGQDGNSVIQISKDNGVTDPYVPVGSSLQNSNSVSLAIAITAVNGNGGGIIAGVPAGYYYKIVNTSTTGTPTFSIPFSAQEISL